MTDALRKKTLDWLLGVITRAKQQGFDLGYAAHQKEAEQAAGEKPEEKPVDVDPIQTVTDGYSRQKAISNIDRLRGGKSYIFAIMDNAGEIYATGEDWIAAGSPAVKGIVYGSSSRHLCMMIEKTPSRPFGGNGVFFNSKVHTTCKQWHKDTTEKEAAAFDDYYGQSNTQGIIEGCTDSIAQCCVDAGGYLPANAEQRIFCKYYPEVDALLKTVGGDPLKIQKGAQLLWSSTCRDRNTAWTVRFMNQGDAQPAYRNKTISCVARIFVEL